jgi:hypothetical protein
MYEYPGVSELDAGLIEQLRAIRVTREKRLTWQGSSYVAPTTIAELAQACAEQADATLVAGGTDVGLWVTKKYMDLPALIYVGNVAELKAVTRSDAHVDIGAAVSLTDAFTMLEPEYPELHEIARRFASPPICNAGTLGGNVANGSPIGDSMPALIALGASVLLQAGVTTRRLPLEEFYLDYMKKDLRKGEFVVAVRVPRRRQGLPAADRHAGVRAVPRTGGGEPVAALLCRGVAAGSTRERVDSCQLTAGRPGSVRSRVEQARPFHMKVLTCMSAARRSTPMTFPCRKAHCMQRSASASVHMRACARWI